MADHNPPRKLGHFFLILSWKLHQTMAKKTNIILKIISMEFHKISRKQAMEEYNVDMKKSFSLFRSEHFNLFRRRVLLEMGQEFQNKKH